jgi:uncharacterized protein
MLRFALCLTALLAAAPAWGQDAPSTPPATDAPSKAQIDAAMDLLKANNTAANMSAVVDTLLPIQAAAIKRAHPGADDAAIAKLVGVVRETIESHEDQLIQIYALAYARHFTIEELHTLSAFYRSEVGAKYINEIPALMKEAAPLAISYMQRIIAQAVQDAIQNMRSQGVKI